MNKRKFLAIACLIAALPVWAANEPLELGIQFVGRDSATSFPKLLLVHVTNPGYTAVNFAQAIATSEIVIDGNPSKRTAAFNGIPGLPALGEWDGCLALEDYAPPITPGKHKFRLKLGNALSAEIKVKWNEPIDWRKGNLKSRLKELKTLANTIDDGLPRDCVERWLTVKDGGLQEADKVRYFLEPQFKAVVPYRQMYETSGLHSVVDGPVTVYEEARLHD